MKYSSVLCLSVGLALAPIFSGTNVEAREIDQLVAKHAAAHGVPESLVRRVIHIESKGNPRVVSKGNYGLMQIRLGTARAMGYQGGTDGLLDADTNMTYAVKYLAGAYRAARGNHEQAIRNYQKGYYYEAKRQGFSPYTLASTQSVPVTQQAATPDPTMLPQETARQEAEQQRAAQREAALQTRVEQQRAAEMEREARRQAIEQQRVMRQQAIDSQRAAQAAQREAVVQQRQMRVAAIEQQRAAQRQAAEVERTAREQARESRRLEQQQRIQQQQQQQQRSEAPRASAQPVAQPVAQAPRPASASAQTYSWYNPMRYFKHPSHQTNPYRTGER